VIQSATSWRVVALTKLDRVELYATLSASAKDLLPVRPSVTLSSMNADSLEPADWSQPWGRIREPYRRFAASNTPTDGLAKPLARSCYRVNWERTGHTVPVKLLP